MVLIITSPLFVLLLMCVIECKAIDVSNVLKCNVVCLYDIVVWYAAISISME